MATEIIVPSSLPNEMSFALPASLPAAKNYEIRVQPVNAQSFQAGNVIQIDIPCGKRGAYLDPTTTYIRFKSTYTATGTVGTQSSFLIGSGYSYFNRQEVYGNNSVTLETIGELGVLANALLQTQLNGSDKLGLGSCMGFSTTNAWNCLGHEINQSVGNPGFLTFEYALPLIGVLGSGSDKMIPVGSIYGLRLELTMDNFANFTVSKTGGAVTGCTISEVEFVGSIIELDAQPQSLIEAQNPQKIHIRSQSYRTSTASLAGQSSGMVDLLIGTRVSSLKSFFMTCSPANALEKKFASVCPNLGQGTCLLAAGLQIPQRTLNPTGHPADCFCELQKSLGALAMVNYNGAVTRDEYYRSSTATGLMAAYNTTLADISTKSPQFVLGLSTETISHRQGLLSGINVNTSPSFLRCQIVAALANVVHTMYCFAMHDVILEFDRNAKTCVAKF